MKETIDIKVKNETIKMEFHANGAGVAKVVRAMFFDLNGQNPIEVKTHTNTETLSSYITFNDTMMTDHLLWLKVNAASMLETPELVGIIIDIYQNDTIIDRLYSNRLMLDGAEIISIKATLKFQTGENT